MLARLCFLVCVVLGATTAVSAQNLTVTTVTREPFSMMDGDLHTGFSMELWRAIAQKLDVGYEISRVPEFSTMLQSVQNGSADLAIANISITAEREQVMDFTLPIFDAGLQILTREQPNSNITMLRALFSWDLLIAILLAFGVLVLMGMLMWRFERKAQPYFDHDARNALFPSFWWALNLVVNGGFEERVPRTIAGRLFGVVLVVSSLFIVSIFVARITAAMTVEAIEGNINSLDDLYDKSVGTIGSSTAAAFLEDRSLDHFGFSDLESMFTAFEDGQIDAIIFDAPILAYYANTRGAGDARVVGGIFLRENYGIALPTGSPLREDINQALLSLREDGTYAAIQRKWFGRSN